MWASVENVLVRSTRPWLTRLDPTTGEIVASIEGPDSSATQGPVIEAFGSVWTVNIEEDRLFPTVSPRTPRATRVCRTPVNERAT